jgi:hypothetical protein
MNWERLKKNIGYHVQLRPEARRFDSKNRDLGTTDDDWIIEQVENDTMTISLAHDAKLSTKLGKDNIYNFTTNPNREADGIKYGFLALNVQVFLINDEILTRPRPRPGERVDSQLGGVSGRRGKRWLLYTLSAIALITILLCLFIFTREKHSRVSNPQATDVSPDVTGRVIFAKAEPLHRFFQRPPVYFERIDTELYVTITNTSSAPLYIQGYSVMALVRGQQWKAFHNLVGLGLDPQEIGFMSQKSLSRIDLSENGFDYLMRKKPLGAKEAIQAWMFFNTGLSESDLFQVTQFRITIMDSTQREHTFFSAFPPGGSSIVAALKVLPKEQIPANLREMPPIPQ